MKNISLKDIKNMSLKELYKIKYKLIKKNKNQNLIKRINKTINEKIKIILEDAYSVGDVSGMGPIISAQPSALPGTTFGETWSDFGGTLGSGDVSAFYSYGNNYVHKKIPVLTYKNKPTNKKKLLKKEKNKKQEILNYNDYIKNNLYKINKVKY